MKEANLPAPMSNKHAHKKPAKILNKSVPYKDFNAVRNASITVRKGECVGLIGENGSGKSTLLQMMAGVITPTKGKLSINGTVAALLELGAGFNPEFTGLENIKMQCFLMGIPKEKHQERVEQIIEFSEMGDFLDRQVKKYSSGMYVRLAFAAALAVDPDILIIDEALAVGDARFQHKCLQKIRSIKAAGKTLLFVSHDLNAVKTLCDRAILLHKGDLLKEGSPKTVVDYYRNLQADDNPSELDQSIDFTKRSGNGKVRITQVRMLNKHGSISDSFSVGEQVSCIVFVLCRLYHAFVRMGWQSKDLARTLLTVQLLKAINLEILMYSILRAMLLEHLKN